MSFKIDCTVVQSLVSASQATTDINKDIILEETLILDDSGNQN